MIKQITKNATGPTEKRGNMVFIGERENLCRGRSLYLSDEGGESMASKAHNDIIEIALARGLGSTALVFSDDEVLLLLRAAIEHDGSRAAFAKCHGVDRTYLNMVLNGGRSVGSPIAKALGLRKAYVVAVDVDQM
jgi:hypothetical protein